MQSTALHAPPTLPGVIRIAVIRGGGLGDLVFTLPAIEALSVAYPEAEIVLLGTRAHAELLAGRSGPVSRVEVLPPAEGVNSPDGGTDEVATARFVRRMRAERFDLVCQLHGGGRFSNPFALRLGARRSVGAATPDATPLEFSLPYLYYQHEIVRWLEVVSLVGARQDSLEPHLAVQPHERALALQHIDPQCDGLLVIHPGASDPRRRWPPERFAEVARRAARDGMQVIIVGDASDVDASDWIAAQSGGTSLAGSIGLSELVGLFVEADIVLGNDSGPRHIAQAVGAPTVGIFWAGNLINGGPLTRGRHRVELGWTTTCPVCGRDCTQVGWTAPRCEHDVSFVSDVGVDAVYSDLRSLMATRARARG